MTTSPTEFEHDDWRLLVTPRIRQDWLNPLTGEWVLAGTRLNAHTSVKLTKKKSLLFVRPAATALLLNSSKRAYDSAHALRQKSKIDSSPFNQVRFNSESDSFDYLEFMIEAIVLAFTAIEAFANEAIPADHLHARYKSSKLILDAVSKEEVERYISIDEKLGDVLPEIFGCTSPKGLACWQRYRELKDARDRIIHMKSADRIGSGDGENELWQNIVRMPPPHVTIKSLIDHYVAKMSDKPSWHQKYPH